MSDLFSYLAMDGYGVYVWPAYGASVIGIAALVWTSVKELAALERVLDQAATKPVATAHVEPSRR